MTATPEPQAPLGRWVTAILLCGLTGWVTLGGLYGTTENSWIPRSVLLSWGVGIAAVLAGAAVTYAVIGQKAFNRARSPQQAPQQASHQTPAQPAAKPGKHK